MIKKFTRPFMPLVLLLSSKAFCNQMPTEDMPKCSEVNLAEQSMPNPEDVLRNCCKEKCKKCKCEKFCKLLVSKNLKTESLSVVKNATVGGNLAVTGSTTLNGYYPVLNQYEQVYNLRGLLSAQPNANITVTPGTPSTNTPTIFPLTVSISNPGVIYSGEGFTVSNITGFGTYYSVTAVSDIASTSLVFSATVTFDTVFTKVPSVVASLNSDVPISTFFSDLNALSLVAFDNVTLFVSTPSTTGFTVTMAVAIDSAAEAAEKPSAALIGEIETLVTGLIQVTTISFIADGLITPSVPVCPPCPTVSSCCR